MCSKLKWIGEVNSLIKAQYPTSRGIYLIFAIFLVFLSIFSLLYFSFFISPVDIFPQKDSSVQRRYMFLS